ncbi:fatty acid desaturase [Nannizzia gypsea CBS 118893]|uniref:Delta 8-(E)-sphingolipid desaturase n=1 Tax=Arthroderma gypseum (strain ATCC MYA-4604 / CBS 118893) TaxID=535722 RepID=E4UPN2_ARTGP|nr:fatty acid desaturase [Nannizzia gypsea CBS 118893]EFQ99069.1 fatty acid desaturase [Nannizzia gypsea CBS 118893]
MNRNRIFSAREVEDRIARGQTIVIADNRVLRLDGWLKYHPGGILAVRHMIGRDATDEINIYHSEKTLATMDKYRIGRVEGPWISMTPPIRGGIFSTMDDSSTSSSDDESRGSDTSVTSMEDIIETQEEVKTEIRKRAASRRAGTQNKHMTPEEYTDKLVQKELDDDHRNYPSLDPETQRHIATKYKQLHQRIKDEGLYDCPYIEYGKELIRYSILFGLFIITLRAGWYIPSAVFLGLFWHQIMFTAHDGGHLAITHNFVIDTLIAMFIADFCCGLSIGWWKSSHNVHHLVPNHPEHDPDIQNIPFFATSPSFFKSLRSTYYDFVYVWDEAANIIGQYQHISYYPIMAIARFNLLLLSWMHLLSPRSASFGAVRWTKPTEILFMCCYWYLYGYCLLWCTIPTWPMRIAFVLISHIITMGLHVQITLSHFAMSTSDVSVAECFAQRQLRTTMDVDCPAWLDWVHGGLQFQAIHHLFPRVPRHNLRKLQGWVKEFAEEVGIDYKIYGFEDGNRKVLGRLGEVSKQVEMLVQCQKYMAATGESGLH